MHLGESLEVRLRGRDPARAIVSIFGAAEVYRWPDLESHWFARLVFTREWQIVHWNPLNDALTIDLSDFWSFRCPTGYEAWLRWNVRVEKQLVKLSDPPYRKAHETRLVIFRQSLIDLYQPTIFTTF